MLYIPDNGENEMKEKENGCLVNAHNNNGAIVLWKLDIW